ncbi:hypothetical protein G7Z17_g8111 [Cylindrodendrum hubeiense]|uniref:Uncharacterized protein n=1 Tax=Cylindrodendrum hubeiense TaxID=595255 RepID=A0A9P5H1T2_9HYPO|nr:hypothetical protein G7Z17_g8111 [Cylindrodendrum hubeiense]
MINTTKSNDFDAIIIITMPESACKHATCASCPASCCIPKHGDRNPNRAMCPRCHPLSSRIPGRHFLALTRVAPRCLVPGTVPRSYGWGGSTRIPPVVTLCACIGTGAGAGAGAGAGVGAGVGAGSAQCSTPIQKWPSPKQQRPRERA